MKPFLLVLSSPSGGGKTTIARRLLEQRNDVGYSVSATTRSPRPGEQHGKDYYFLDLKEFTRQERAGEFLETATYGGYRYGTLKREVQRVFGEGKHVVLDIETEGARQVRRRAPESVHVFVWPPSAPGLIERLKGRGTESPQALRRRMRRAIHEIAEAGKYDYVIGNEDLEAAVTRLGLIVDLESLRVFPRRQLSASIARMSEELRKSVRNLGGAKRPARRKKTS